MGKLDAIALLKWIMEFWGEEVKIWRGWREFKGMYGKIEGVANQMSPDSLF